MQKNDTRVTQRCRVAIGMVAAGVLTVGTTTGGLHAGEAELPEFEIIDLGTLGGELANGIGLNNSGQVVGQAEFPNLASVPFVWSEGEGIAHVGSLSDADGGRADGINNHGHIVGNAMAPAPVFGGYVATAFLWTPEDGMVDISPEPNPTDGASYARDINDAGQICLNFMRGNHEDSGPWLREPDGTMVPIRFENPLVGWGMDAWEMNESGVVVGGGWTPKFEFRGFRFDTTDGIVELDTLGGRDSQAWGINDAEVIVGQAEHASGQAVPAMWLAGETTPIELPLLEALPGENPIITGEAEAINNDNWMVGDDHSLEHGDRTIAWLLISDATGESVVKDRLVHLIPSEDAAEWELTAALDVNDHGWITGIGVRTIDGVEYPGRAFLMRPVTPGTCPADLTGDETVNVFDLLDLLGAWGACPRGECAADLTNDGTVNVFDLLDLLGAWGECG